MGTDQAAPGFPGGRTRQGTYMQPASATKNPIIRLGWVSEPSPSGRPTAGAGLSACANVLSRNNGGSTENASWGCEVLSRSDTQEKETKVTSLHRFQASWLGDPEGETEPDFVYNALMTPLKRIKSKISAPVKIHNSWPEVL